MFSFKETKLNSQTHLSEGHFGPFYPYQNGPDDNKWAVQVIRTTNKQLPQIIEAIVVGFSCNQSDTVLLKGFSMKPAEKTSEKVDQWDVFIKIPLDKVDEWNVFTYIKIL